MPRVFLSTLSANLVLTLCSACGDAQGGGETAGTGDTNDASGTTMHDPTASDGSAGDGGTGSASSGDGTGEPQTTDGPDDMTGTTTAGGSTGDGTGDDGTTGAVEQCDAPVDPLPCDHADPDVFKALGLNCQEDPSKAIPLLDSVVKAEGHSYRVAKSFGTAVDPIDPTVPAWAAQEGEQLLIIGTGQFPHIDKKDGSLHEKDNQDSQANGNPDGLIVLPGVIKHQYGSNDGEGGTPFVDCDGLHDCSDTILPQWELDPENVANDVFYMDFELVAPAGTHGFAIDFVFFSEEWPVYVDTPYNDMLIVWSTSESYTGNITYLDDEALTATSLDPFMKHQPGDDVLAGTALIAYMSSLTSLGFTATQYALLSSFMAQARTTLAAGGINAGGMGPFNDQLTDERPLFAITPNRDELEALTGTRARTARQVCAAADLLHSRGVRLVWVRLGAAGAHRRHPERALLGARRHPAAGPAAG